ncbi:hypothetical protein [Mastigocladopsis repens]|nr:hypothetical protein [Mastigocladopsis repens]
MTPFLGDRLRRSVRAACPFGKAVPQAQDSADRTHELLHQNLKPCAM